MVCPSELGLPCRLMSVLFGLIISLNGSSFLSIKPINFLRLVEQTERWGLGGWISSTSASSPWSSGVNLRYWQMILQKNTTREMEHAMPQIRNRPQKLFRERWFSSISLPCAEQSACVSHLLWIFWRSPFSDSCRMAVDKSTARGESLWNACNKKIWL